ncbi:MAG: TlpA disulfide reductase family protein [Methylococcaceae bacterium]
MTRTRLFIFLTGLIALTAGWYARYADLSFAAEKQQLPSFSLPDLTGQKRNIEEWKGKVLVINFWATWCPPCLKEIPDFVALQQQMGSQGLQFIGIALEEVETVTDFVKANSINYPILIGDQDGVMLSKKMGNVVSSVPFSVVIDRENNIVARQLGAFTPAEIKKVVIPLLQKNRT